MPVDDRRSEHHPGERWVCGATVIGAVRPVAEPDAPKQSIRSELHLHPSESEGQGSNMGVRWIVAFLLATCLAPTQAAQAADRAAVGCYRLESHADQRDCLEALAAETTQLVEKLGGKALADVTEWDQEASYRGRTQTYLRKSIGAFAEGKSAECELQASLAAGGNAASDRRLICQIDMNERRISELLAIDATLLEGDAAALLIRVRRGIYEAGGKSFGSAADLEGMLRERRPTKVRVLPEPGAQYRDVAGVMTAIQHVGGIDVGLVGSKTPE